jgi:hypothetical protein
MKSKHTLKLLILSALVLLLTAAILTGAEKYLRLKQYERMAGVIDNDHFIRIKNLAATQTLSFRPNYKQNKMDSFPLEEKDYVAHTDSFGFIVTDKNTARPDARISFFGGSTAQCLFVEEDKRMPEAVGRILEQKTGKKINVWNCAAGGTHSYHTLNVFNNMAVNLNTDYAFFYGNLNDVSALMHYGTYYNPNIDKGMFFTTEGFNKKYQIATNGLLPYTRDALKAALHMKPEVDDFSDIRGLKLTTDPTLLMPQFARVMKMIIASCKANHVKPVLITQRNNFDKLSYEWLLKNMPFFTPSAEEYEKVKVLFAEYNNTLRQIAKEENVLLIDLDGPEIGFDNYYDAIHFNTKGSVTVSEMIAERFLALTANEQKNSDY